ncbi:MAG: hypothetical protein J7K83_00115 [Candidatus Aenigmarchaeota archaeon]|nr:hypothetical protein [Candidatus Aenigmarchaeota archaeon]
MPSLQKSSKAQFFVLSAIIIVTAAYSLSRAYFMKKLPAENLVSDELFIVQNLNIIYNRTANISKDCLMFKYNVEDVSQFLQNELEKMGYDVNITTTPVRICASGQSEMIVDFKLRSSLLEVEKNITVRWPSTYP